MSNQKEIIEAIAEHLTLPVSDVDLESHMQDDLGLNRVEIADLLTWLSRKFNIIFDPTDMEDIETVGDLVDLIEDKLLE